MARPKPLRGEIWRFDLNPKKGHEQRGVRPCLVVSTDWVETDQIVTVDTRHRALRHLATVVDEDKLRAVEDSLRRMLSL
jgi:mRNA-degrading endonuclease toxin of MazEF toxin-antitoxin module